MDDFLILLDNMVSILRHQLSGQVFLPSKLTGAVYRHFLNGLPVPLEHVPVHQQQHMWFMHDRAPPHFLRTVRQRLRAKKS
jgi:hypothetical protein